MPPAAQSGGKHSAAGPAPRKRSTVKDALKNAASAPGQRSLFAFVRKEGTKAEQNAGACPSAPSRDAGLKDASRSEDATMKQELSVASDSGTAKGCSQLTGESSDSLAHRMAGSASDEMSPRRSTVDTRCESKPSESDPALESDPVDELYACANDLQHRGSPTPMQKVDELLSGGSLSHRRDPKEPRTPGSRSLRERLNKRLHAPDGGAPSERAPGLSLPDTDMKLSEHKTIGGGVSLQWRFLLDPTARDAVREQRRRTEDSLNQSSSELSSSMKQSGTHVSETAGKVTASSDPMIRNTEASPEKVAQPTRREANATAAADDQSDGDIGKDACPDDNCFNSSEHERRDAKTENPKYLLDKLGLDYPACAGPEDMQALLERYQSVCSRPLSTLRALCYNLPNAALADADTCVRFLLKPASRRRSASDNTSAGADSLHASSLAERILALQPCRFPSRTAFAFAIFSLESMREPSDTTSLQSSYRQLMRKLHPDRVGTSESAARALELVQEARRLCELALSNTHAPLMPHSLRATTSVTSSGSRKVQLTWQPSPHREDAPVDRYIVAAVDPCYGHRAVNLAVLEPDYCDKLGRFVHINELCAYTVEESANGRVSAGLFHNTNVLLQVAAANAAGQSAWATVTVTWNHEQTRTLPKARGR
eukprot:TRINITY_DN15930_c0_g1_i1.p1 TRINITY_DN15930_c0_g1~~TRINITY_DN15930_c0_g1_i1.p1  ORF type:complete len:656 (+),score=86.02 TRINITY_DN15930_c0_g1_i1:40-2007(+)